MSPPLLTLPDELIVELFSYLHPRDIVACQRACRQLNDTIIHSQLLQYLIRLGRSGLYDPLLSSHTVSQRIEALEKWETAWGDVEIKSSDHIKYKVACPFTWRYNSACRVHDDFLIVLNCFDSPGYGYVDLRVFQPGGERSPLTVIANHGWRGKNCLFALSVEQDLVLAVLSPKQHTSSMLIELHGIGFSRGTPHPYVVGAVIPTVSTNEFMDVAIVGDRTILNITSFVSQRIFLHSWKDGHTYLLRETSKPAWSHRLVAISLDVIALVETDSVALEICRIVEEPDGGVSLCTIVRLGLPPLAPEAFIRFSYCIRESVPTYSDAPSLVTEGRPPRHPPFHSSPEEGLVVVVMTIGIHATSTAEHVTIVTHLRSLVALAATTPPRVTFIPWENWGPRAAACFELRVRPKSDVLMGDRLATIRNETLSLFDFNSTRIRDALQRASRSSGRTLTVDLMTINHRSVIPGGMLFKEDVVGELPYISVVKPAAADWKSLINHEEELAGLSWNVRGQLVSLCLLAFWD